MSAEAITWAFEQDLPTDEKFVLVVLADNGGSDATRAGSSAFLARSCGLHPARVAEIMASLQSVDLLRITRTASGVNGDVVYETFVKQELHAPPKRRPQGYVYLIWSLLCEMDVARRIERDILDRFDDRRLHGEWVNVEPDELIRAAEAIATKYGAKKP